MKTNNTNNGFNIDAVKEFAIAGINSRDAKASMSLIGKAADATLWMAGALGTTIKVLDDVTDKIPQLKAAGDIAKTNTGNGWRGELEKTVDVAKLGWKQGQSTPLWLLAEGYDIFGVDNEKMAGEVAKLDSEIDAIVQKYAELAKKK